MTWLKSETECIFFSSVYHNLTISIKRVLTSESDEHESA